MRVKDMHPLCCISLEGAGNGSTPAKAIGDESPELLLSRVGSLKRSSTLPRSDFGNAAGCRGSDVSVAGPLFKWTNYGKGWRSRWFLLRGDGLLSYSKINSLNSVGDDVRVIGDMTSARLNRMDSRKPSRGSGSVVQLKVRLTLTLLNWRANGSSRER